MLHKNRSFRKYSVALVVLCLWIWWDLSQAHSAMTTVYTNFFPASDSKAALAQQTTVALVRSDDSTLANSTSITDAAISYTTIKQMVRRAITLAGGFQGLISSGNMVLIKPNIGSNADSSGSGGITDVRVVQALVEIIDELDHGKIHIVVGDGSPRPYTTFEKATGTTQTPWIQLFDVPGYQILKTKMLAAGIDFRLSNLNGNSDTNPWSELQLVTVPGGGSAQPQGGQYYIHQDVLNADVFITVPVMKIHAGPGMTCALKNQIGIAPSTKYGFIKKTGVAQDNYQHYLRHAGDGLNAWNDKEIVDLSSIAMMTKKRFCLVDAIACVESDKTPKYGTGNIISTITNGVRMNCVVAGKDPVAVDHVCARLMMLNPDDIEHITLAERVGLGTNDSSKITIAGASIAATRRPFKKTNATTDYTSRYGQGNREWIFNGPFAIGSLPTPIDYAFLADEATLTPTPGNNGWSQSMYCIEDRINMKAFFNLTTEQVVGYAFCYFNAPADQTVQLWVGSDEDVKIYLNGTVVYSYKGTRTFTVNPSSEYFNEIVNVNVKKGMNKLLVKALQKTGDYLFSLNICDIQTNVNYRGSRIWGLKFFTNPGSTNAVNNVRQIASSFRLNNCYPNPFNGAIQIPFTLNQDQAVDISIYNTLGQRVKTILHGMGTSQTSNVVVWDGSSGNGSAVSSGIYFVVMKNAYDQMAVKKIAFVK
jgi:uncharacterized protein (DUF362 family)